MVEAVGIRMAFGGVEVLRGVDLSLRDGEMHAIVGENGAGKSTLAKIVAGVYRPTSGQLLLDGGEITFASPRQAMQYGVALIHQEPLSFPDLSVAENIFVGHQPRGRFGVDWNAMRARAKALLDELGVSLPLSAKVASLSVADRQLLELASALSHEARVLIFDETTASLTPKEVAELFVIVRRLRDQGCAIAFVSHHLEEVFAISDRISVLRDGALVATVATKETSIPEVVRMMVGREVTLSRRQRKPRGEPVLEVRDLSVPSRVHGVTLTVHAGEIVGLGGLVGAGRTDLCRAVFGACTSSGSVRLTQASSRAPRHPRQAMERGMAMVPEDRQHEGLLMPMKIRENATLAALRGWWLRPQIERSTAEAQLRALQTAFRSVEQPVSELSGGNQQKVVLAKWLLSKPRLLILDEPTRGVDVGAKEEVHRLISELAEEGIAILMVSSDLPELLSLSDRILVMRQGRLVAELDGGKATEQDVMFAATGQVAA